MRTLLKRLARVAAILVALVFVVYTGLYLFWNDAAIARTVSGWVSGSLRGAGGERKQAFTIGSAHYPYWCSLGSVLFGGSCTVDVRDVTVYDAAGAVVLRGPRIVTGFYVGEVVWAQLFGLFTGGDLELHFVDADVLPGAAGDIHPVAGGEINLVQAFSSNRPPAKSPGRGGMVIRVDSGRVHGGDFRMSFPGWSGHLGGLDAASLRLRYSSFPHENTDKERPAFTYRIEGATAASGELDLGAFHFPLERVAVSRFGADDEARDQLRFAGAVTSRGAPATVEGRLEATYSTHPGADLAIRFEHGRGLVAMLPTGELLGGDPSGEVRIHGPFSHALIDGAADGAEVHLAGLTAVEAGATLHLDGPRLALPAAHARIGKGHVVGSVLVDFIRLSWEAELFARDVDPADLAPLVPPAEGRLLAGDLDGGALVRGSFNPLAHPERIFVSGVAARLGRRGRGPAWLPRTLELHGDLRYHLATGRAPDRLLLDGVRLEGDGVVADAHGTIEPKRFTADAMVTAHGDHLGPLLARLGAPEIVEGVELAAHVTGRIADPTLDGTLVARGVGLGTLSLPRVDADLRLDHGRLTATHVHGEGPVGAVDGRVELGLWHVPAPTIRAHLVAERLRIHVLTDNPLIQGELSGRVDLDGPLADLRGSAELRLPTLDLFGDAYRDGDLAITLGEGDRVHVDTVKLTRVGGGALFGSGDVETRGPLSRWGLDIDLTPTSFPLAAIGPLRTLPVALGGTLSGRVHLGGEVGHWLPSGVIDAAGLTVRDFSLGSGQLRLDPDGDAIHLTGSFWHFKVDGHLRLRPSIAVEVRVSFDDLPVDDLVPEMRKLAEVKATVWGEASFAYDLAVGTPRADLRLRKVLLTLAADEEDEEGRHHVAEFRNEGDVVMESDGTSLSIKQATLRSRRDETFQVSGDLSATRSNLHLVGNIQLPMLEYFVSSWFCHTHGDADAELTVTGPIARPHIIGRIDLKGAELEPRVDGCHAADAEAARRLVFVPSGRVAFEDDGIRLLRLREEVDGAAADVSGRVALRDWVPGAVQLDVTGDLSPKVLEWLLPDQIAESDGRLGVDAHVRGTYAHPTWQGAVRVRDLRFRAKRLGRDVTITGGTVGLDNYDVTLGCPRWGSTRPGCRTVTARIDATSELALDGTLGFAAGGLERLRVHVKGENLEWGSANIYSLTLSPDVELSGAVDDQLRLAGHVTLVSGTFTQPFEEKDLVIRPRTVESDPPFYEGIPALEDMALRLTASSSGPLSIRNNVAPNVQLSVPLLSVGGTLSQPTLSGTVLVEEGGTFKIPFAHAEFVTERGQIDFKAGLRFPDQTPRFDIHAYSDWADRYEQIHHIVLTVLGTYRQLELDLKSTDGWDKAQVLSAIVTGGSPDDLRNRFKNDPTQPQGSGGNGALQTATGDLTAAIVGDPLQTFLAFDTVRIELGYVKLCKYNTRYIKLCGTGEGQITPTSHYDARLELKLSDDFSAAAAAEHIEHGIDTSEDVVNRGRLQLRVKVPIF